MTRILIWEGANLKVSGLFVKAGVEAVLIFGAETWILTPRVERALNSFQHSFTQRINWRHSRREGGRRW